MKKEKQKKTFRVKRVVEEWYQVEAYSKKEAEQMPKEDPYATIVIKEVAKPA